MVKITHALGITMQLTPAPGLHPHIDFMLRLLADEIGPAAIGVVLSGTASDGTLGIKAIKAAGGMTFAQDEDSAQYFGMPGNAIASGAVDFVLPPAEIARELGRIARHPYLRDRVGRTEGEEDPGASTDQMTQVFRLLRARTGHDFSYYKHDQRIDGVVITLFDRDQPAP